MTMNFGPFGTVQRKFLPIREWVMTSTTLMSDLEHEPMASSPAHVHSTIINKKTKSTTMRHVWWHQLLWSRAWTNGQLTSTCPLHNNQQENQIEISSHSSHESRTGSGHPGIRIKKLSKPNPWEKVKEEDGDEITGEKAVAVANAPGWRHLRAMHASICAIPSPIRLHLHAPLLSVRVPGRGTAIPESTKNFMICGPSVRRWE